MSDQSTSSKKKVRRAGPETPISRQTRAIRRIANALEQLPPNERRSVLAFVNESEGQEATPIYRAPSHAG